MERADDRARPAAALLRQLWLGLSAYRMFPGSLDRPGFVAAAERIARAAELALAGGPFEADVRGGALCVEGLEIAPDEAIERLAVACFERRVERIVVRSVPDVHDLDRIFSVLTTPADELRQAGGADNVLLGEAVTSIELQRVGPDAVEGADHVPDEMAVEPPPAVLLDADVLASELMMEDLSGTSADQAETMLERLRSIVSELPSDRVPDIDVQAVVHEAMTRLPDGLRHALIDALVERAAEDPVAGRMIGSMSSAELARALIDLGAHGRRDPVELARQLASAGVRPVDVIDLTAALQAGHVEAGTIIAGLEQLGVDLAPSDGEPTARSVTQLLSQYLAATQADDRRSLGMLASRTERERREGGLLVLHDYLVLEEDVERVGEVLDVWALRLRSAVLERDARLVSSLVSAVREAFAGDARSNAGLFEPAVRGVLDAETVDEFLGSIRHGGVDDALIEVLEPFGDVAVEALLDVLADEEERERRALLLSVLRRIVPGHTNAIADRLGDPRWFVVRNAVGLLGVAGGPRALTLLVPATRHGSAAVRRAAVEAIAGAGGDAAVPHLRRLAFEATDDVPSLAVAALGTLVGGDAAGALADVVRHGSSRPLRAKALEALVERPEALPLLRELGSKRAQPRLPRKLRRQARAGVSRLEAFER